MHLVTRITDSSILFLPLALFSAFLISACTYMPEDISLTEIEYDFSDIQVNFDDSSDTLRVSGNIQLQFNMDFSGREIQSSTVFLNNEELPNAITYGSNGYSIRLNTTDYEDGYFNLALSFIVKSGSGSLADQLETEFLTVDLTKVLFIDNSPVSPLQILNQNIVNGELQVTWNKYNGFGFQGYSIGCLHIANANDTIGAICNYAGGKTNIRLELKAKQQSATTHYSYSDDLNGSATLDNDHLKISWDPTPYYKNFLFYEVSTSDLTQNHSFNSQTFREINQTNFQLERRGFPSGFSVSAKVNGNYFIERARLGDLPLVYTYGSQVLKLTKLKDNKVAMLISSGMNSTLLYVFNRATGDIIKYYDHPADVSSDGSKIYIIDGSVIKTIETKNLNEIASFNLNSFNKVFNVTQMRVSNDKVYIQNIKSDSQHEVLVFNISNNQIQKTLTNINFLLNYAISRDGKYFYSNNFYDSRHNNNPSSTVFDIENEVFLGTQSNGFSLSQSNFIEGSNRLLKFDELNLYSTNIDGLNRTDLNIPKNNFERFTSLGGDKIAAFNEYVDADIFIFDPKDGSNYSQIAKVRYPSSSNQGYFYSANSSYLIAMRSGVLYLRDIE